MREEIKAPIEKDFAICFCLLPIDRCVIYHQIFGSAAVSTLPLCLVFEEESTTSRLPSFLTVVGLIRYYHSYGYHSRTTSPPL